MRLLLLAGPGDLLMPLLPLQLLLRIPERLHVVGLLLVVTGFLLTPKVMMDVMVKAPVLLVTVLVAAAPQDERLVVVHS